MTDRLRNSINQGGEPTASPANRGLESATGRARATAQNQSSDIEKSHSRCPPREPGMTVPAAVIGKMS